MVCTCQLVSPATSVKHVTPYRITRTRLIALYSVVCATWLNHARMLRCHMTIYEHVTSSRAHSVHACTTLLTHAHVRSTARCIRAMPARPSRLPASQHDSAPSVC